MECIFYLNKEDGENVEFLPNCDIRTHTISGKDEVAHFHTYYEFFYIIEGSIVHCLNGEDKVLTIGDLYIIRPNCDKHYFKRINGTSCTHRDIMFSSDIVPSTCKFLGIDFDNADFEKIFPVKLGIKDIEHFERIVQNILFYSEKDQQKQNSLVRLLATELLSASLMSETDSMHVTNAPPWLSEFLSLFKKADIIKRGLPELKKHMPFSYEHVGRAHKEFLGKTIVEHLTEVRMSYAATLLTTTDLSMLSIAMEVGYNSLSHFNRTFNKYYNISPYAYKKKKISQSQI